MTRRRLVVARHVDPMMRRGRSSLPVGRHGCWLIPASSGTTHPRAFYTPSDPIRGFAAIPLYAAPWRAAGSPWSSGNRTCSTAAKDPATGRVCDKETINANPSPDSTGRSLHLPWPILQPSRPSSRAISMSSTTRSPSSTSRPPSTSWPATTRSATDPYGNSIDEWAAGVGEHEAAHVVTLTDVITRARRRAGRGRRVRLRRHRCPVLPGHRRHARERWRCRLRRSRPVHQ